MSLNLDFVQIVDKKVGYNELFYTMPSEIFSIKIPNGLHGTLACFCAFDVQEFIEL
jgi:hypothetical protein